MVRISKDGVYFQVVTIDEEGNEEVTTIDVLATSLGIVSYLTYPVTLEEDVTVEDIMNILALNMDSTDFVFDSSLGGFPFTSFYEELKGEAEEQMFSYMEVAHESDPVTEELFSIARMRGVGKNNELFSVEFTPIASYKHMKIVLNNEYTIIKIGEDEKKNNIFSTKKAFTLFEFIHALLFEMSYYGDASSRKNTLDDMLETLGVEKIEGFRLNSATDRNDINNLKKELQALIEKEDYEGAAILRDKIKNMLENKEEQSDDTEV